MSVDLTVSAPGRETEFIAFLPEQSATRWLGVIARTHQFKVLTGEYPTPLLQIEGFDQVIYELRALCAIDVARFEDTDSRGIRERLYDRIIDRLQKLKSEPDVEVYFG